jgi:cytochrome b6-f complex iron-sulfur subunit
MPREASWPPSSERVRLLVAVGALASAAAGLVAVMALLTSFAWPQSGLGDAQANVQAGRVDDYAVGRPVFFSDGRFWLVRQANGGFVAFSAADSFRGCTVLWRPDYVFEDPRDGVTKQGWFRDPCHGSVYDLHGTKVTGPSPRDLDRFPVDLMGPQVVVHASPQRLIPGEARPDYEPFGTNEGSFHSIP